MAARSKPAKKAKKKYKRLPPPGPGEPKRPRGRPRGRTVTIVPDVVAQIQADAAIDAAAADIERQLDADNSEVCAILPALDLGNNGIDERWRNIPGRPLAMLVLRALGLSTREVAKAVGTSQQLVIQNCNKYDPKRIFVLSPDQREAIAAARWSQHEHQLLTAATARQDELGAMELYRAAGLARDKQLKSRQVKAEERQEYGAVIGKIRHALADNNIDSS